MSKVYANTKLHADYSFQSREDIENHIQYKSIDIQVHASACHKLLPFAPYNVFRYAVAKIFSKNPTHGYSSLLKSYVLILRNIWSFTLSTFALKQPQLNFHINSSSPFFELKIKGAFIVCIYYAMCAKSFTVKWSQNYRNYDKNGYNHGTKVLLEIGSVHKQKNKEMANYRTLITLFVLMMISLTLGTKLTNKRLSSISVAPLALVMRKHDMIHCHSFSFYLFFSSRKPNLRSAARR